MTTGHGVGGCYVTPGHDVGGCYVTTGHGVVVPDMAPRGVAASQPHSTLPPGRTIPDLSTAYSVGPYAISTTYSVAPCALGVPYTA
eukprot:1224180-Rhodomonas_salina.4